MILSLSPSGADVAIIHWARTPIGSATVIIAVIVRRPGVQTLTREQVGEDRETRYVKDATGQTPYRRIVP